MSYTMYILASMRNAVAKALASQRLQQEQANAVAEARSIEQTNQNYQAKLSYYNSKSFKNEQARLTALLNSKTSTVQQKVYAKQKLAQYKQDYSTVDRVNVQAEQVPLKLTKLQSEYYNNPKMSTASRKNLSNLAYESYSRSKFGGNKFSSNGVDTSYKDSLGRTINVIAQRKGDTIIRKIKSSSGGYLNRTEMVKVSTSQTEKVLGSQEAETIDKLNQIGAKRNETVKQYLERTDRIKTVEQTNQPKNIPLKENTENIKENIAEEKPLNFWGRLNKKIADTFTKRILPTYENVEAGALEPLKNIQGKIRAWEVSHLPAWLVKENKSSFDKGMREGFYNDIREQPLKVAGNIGVGAVIGSVGYLGSLTKVGATIVKGVSYAGAVLYVVSKGTQIAFAENNQERGKIVGSSVLEAGSYMAGAGLGAGATKYTVAKIYANKKPISIKDIGKVELVRQKEYDTGEAQKYNIEAIQTSKVQVGKKLYDVTSKTKGNQYIYDNNQRSISIAKTEYLIDNKVSGAETQSISFSQPSLKNSEEIIGLQASKTNYENPLVTLFRGKEASTITIKTNVGIVTYPQQTSIYAYISRHQLGQKGLRYGVQQISNVGEVGNTELYLGQTQSFTKSLYKQSFDLGEPTLSSELAMNKKGNLYTPQTVQPEANTNPTNFKPTFLNTEKNIVNAVRSNEFIGTYKELPSTRTIVLPLSTTENKQENLVISGSIEEQATKTKQEVISLPVQASSNIELSLTAQEQANESLHKKLQLEKQIPVLEVPTFVIAPPVVIPKTEIIPIPTLLFTKGNQKGKGLFNVLVRSKGEFKLVATLPTYQKAFNFGTGKVLNTASASFKIEPVNNKVPNKNSQFLNSRVFYQSKREPGVVIQKREFRIGTAGEKREITYKGIQANINKRKKLWRF